MRHSGAETFTSDTIPGQRSSAVHTPLSSGSSSCILRILKQCTNSRLHTWLARASRSRWDSDTTTWLFADIVAALWCSCKNSKSCTAVSPAVLPPVSETNRASRWRICGKSGPANFHCLLCASTPRGWSPPICFTFLSVLFMEHKYYMTISKIKGANFRLEA